MPGKEVHVFCAAYRADEMDELLRYADHIVFNSPAQLANWPRGQGAGKSVGLRINPECSTQDGHAITTLRPGSRLARPAPSGTRQRQKILPARAVRTACTFTLYVSRTPMRWP